MAAALLRRRLYRNREQGTRHPQLLAGHVLQRRTTGTCPLDHASFQVASVSIGDQHACAILLPPNSNSDPAVVTTGNVTRRTLVGGNVTCWGSDKFGRCILGARSSITAAPHPHAALRVTGTYPDGAEFIAAAFPASFQGRFAPVQPPPPPPPPPPSLPPLQVCAASSHTCALDASGTIWCWGNNMLDRAKV